MSERTCLMVDIAELDWSKIAELSVKYKVPTGNGNARSSAGMIRMLLILIIRKNRIKGSFEDDVPEKLRSKAESSGIYDLEMIAMPETCHIHRQIRTSESLKQAIEKLAEMKKLQYGSIVRNLIKFAIEKL